MTPGAQRSTLWKAAGVLGMAGLWQAASRAGDAHLLPGLELIGARLVDLLRSGELLENATSTLSKGLAGLLLALVLGTAIGTLCARNRFVNAALQPLISVLYPVPKLALYPVVILVLGLGAWSKIVQVMLECFFPIFVQMYAGAKSVPKTMVWLAANNETSARRFASDVLLPSMLPFLLTGLRVATPIMLIVMCVTEFIGESRGLGYLVSRYSSYFDTAAAFAVIVFLGLLGLVADRLIVFVRTRLVHWERGVSL